MTASSSPLGIFERYLSLWVGLCIAALEYASVNLVVAVFIWVMIYPMMVNVDFASLKDVGKKPKGLCITLVAVMIMVAIGTFSWSSIKNLKTQPN